ncbi:MAG: methyltransferase [Dyadobacter sp.]|uniref:methyltransferase n=1 Tax=Dyadobacter sp. TaxID=1914288 RepID=UPI003265C702
MSTIEIEQEQAVSPVHILQTGMSFWPAKTLLTAVKLGLFTELADGPLFASEIQDRLKLHERSYFDFLDALVALGFLQRAGIGFTATYENTPETALFLDRNTPAYVGGLLEMANDRLYPYWGDLEEALRTGLPQNEIKRTGKPLFEAIYADPSGLEIFLEGMAGAQVGNFMTLAEAFDFSPYKKLVDIGGANALLSVCVAQRHPALQCLSVDLPPVAPIAQKNVEKLELTHRIQVGTLDFTSQAFPEADVITMGNILHDWNLEEKKMLIGKAYEALPAGGALVVIENIIDDERKENAFGLMMSLNMAVETPGGFDYTHADFHQWATEAGFRSTAKIHLAGPSSAVIAYK